jgi:hypothetical protein
MKKMTTSSAPSIISPNKPAAILNNGLLNTSMRMTIKIVMKVSKGPLYLSLPRAFAMRMAVPNPVTFTAFGPKST